jgi:hypothetical protein
MRASCTWVPVCFVDRHSLTLSLARCTHAHAAGRARDHAPTHADGGFPDHAPTHDDDGFPDHAPTHDDDGFPDHDDGFDEMSDDDFFPEVRVCVRVLSHLGQRMRGSPPPSKLTRATAAAPVVVG